MTGIVWNVKCGTPLEGDAVEILMERYTRDKHEKYLNRTKRMCSLEASTGIRNPPEGGR